jgi:hypothetical protein
MSFLTNVPLTDFQKILTTPAELLPELVPYVQKANGIVYLHHPLMIEPFYTPQLNNLYNHRFQFKRDQLIEAEATQNWSQAIWLHERPYRIEYFARIAKNFKDVSGYPSRDNQAIYWSLLGSLLVDCEDTYNNKKTIKRLVQAAHIYDPDRSFMMTESEFNKFNELACKGLLTVYRGCLPFNKKGFSWTLDPIRAEWFAKRFAQYHGQQGLVLTGQVLPSYMIAYFDRRGEDEVFILNPALVTVINTFKV